MATVSVKREQLLGRLKTVSIGLSDKDMLEQSSSFVFSDDRIRTFNDEVYADVPGVKGIGTMVVGAASLTKLLAKFPDDELELSNEGSELRIKGKRRKAGIAVESDVRLPFASVPAPGKFKALTDGTALCMLQAARCCGSDETRPMATVVHCGPDVIEGCDNTRLMRAAGVTGFRDHVLLPATAVHELCKLPIKSVSVENGWGHFEVQGGGEVRIRGIAGDYPVMEAMTKIGGVKLKAPEKLIKVIERASVMCDDGHLARVLIDIGNGEVCVESKKPDTGWFRERCKVDYKGSPCSFELHPQFLIEVLERSRELEIAPKRLKLEAGRATVVVVTSERGHMAAKLAAEVPAAAEEVAA